MKNWKFKYFEKNTKESHIHVFSSLEMESYIQKLLNDYKLTLSDCKINFLNSTIYIIISIYNTKQNKKTRKKHNKKKILKKKKNLFNNLVYQTKKIATTKTLLNSNKNVSNNNKYHLKSKKQYKIYKPYYLIFNSSYNKKLKLNTKKTFKLNNFSKKLLEGIKAFLKNKYNIIIIIKKLKLALESNLKKNNIKLKLRKFQRSDFFLQGTSILFTFISQANSEKLLTKFIAKELASTKRHKFFLNFLKESFNILINQNFSKISGIKLVIKGRLNNVMRAKAYLIKIGKIPLIAPNYNLTYSEATAYGKNGTLGIKLWILKKTRKQKQCFYNQKK